MRAAFISDIHGNSTALQAVLEDIGRKGIDQIYVLGDLCYRGPDPKGALALVQSLNTRVIKGNADEWVVRGVLPGEVPDKAIGMMNMERDWTVSRLEPQDIGYLEGLPAGLNFEWEGVRVKAFHATPESLFEVVLPSADDEVLQAKLMPEADAELFIYAHIHRPYIRYIHGRILMNIGSVGLPFDGMPKASYAIVEVERGKISTSIERVDFDIEEVIRQYEAGQYPNSEMMAGILRSGSIS